MYSSYTALFRLISPCLAVARYIFQRPAKPLGLLLAACLLQGCASVSTLNGAKTDLPIIYSGTRLDWYALHGGCCPVPRFGSEPPSYPALDLPFSALLDTLVLPFTVLAELGVGVGVSGGL